MTKPVGKFYKVRANCYNCGKPITWHIPRGIARDNELSHSIFRRCYRCGVSQHLTGMACGTVID